jgi:glutaminyl-peptide cyclotransferase
MTRKASLSARLAWVRAGIAIGLVGPLLSCSGSSPSTEPDPDPVDPVPPEPALYGYRVVRAYPHDPTAFTQGLVWADGFLYEGTGLHGQSSVRQVELETGRVRRAQAVDARYFGEGITVFQNRLFQLTWQEGTWLLYNLADLSLAGTYAYPREGWGLTYDGTRLVASDGTAILYYLDPYSMASTAQVQVRTPAGPVRFLNELEWVEGEIYANVWGQERIARISPADGFVTGWIDLRGLLPAADRTAAVDVLNGIAYDAAGQRLFVTGKLWPKMFEIQVVPQ